MKENLLPPHKWLIAYDSDCVFCTSGIQFVERHDHNNNFLYTSLNSTISQQILQTHSGQDIPDSVILFDEEKIYYKSDAILKICSKLDGLFILCKFLKIIPRFIRDIVYDFIAKHRYKIISRDKECPIPSEEFKAKIIY